MPEPTARSTISTTASWTNGRSNGAGTGGQYKREPFSSSAGRLGGRTTVPARLRVGGVAARAPGDEAPGEDRREARRQRVGFGVGLLVVEAEDLVGQDAGGVAARGQDQRGGGAVGGQRQRVGCDEVERAQPADHLQRR